MPVFPMACDLPGTQPESSREPSLLPLICPLAPAASGERRTRARAAGPPRHQKERATTRMVGRHVGKKHDVSGRRAKGLPFKDGHVVRCSKSRCTQVCVRTLDGKQ